MDFFMKDYMGVNETAKYLNVHANTFLYWRKTGLFNVPYTKLGGRARYLKSDVDAFIAANKITPGQ
jgi:excisionase family DNA binding protein